METNIRNFAESAKGFTKGPLGIIALFIVLVYGFASIVVGFGNNIVNYITPLIYFLVSFPFVVFFGFLWLVAKHYNKLYGPESFKEEDNFIKMISTAVSLTAATVKQPTNPEVSQEQVEKIPEIVSRINKYEKRNIIEKILWVDDRPENNIYERKAFEAQGLRFSLALNTDEAVDLLGNNEYVAIISDMGRKEGPQEGYVLLDKVRQMGIKIPFYIYAGSNAPEHKKMAKEHGAQGSTNRADELYKMVMNRL